MLIVIVTGIVTGIVPLTLFRVSGPNCAQAAFAFRDWNLKLKLLGNTNKMMTTKDGA